MTPQTLSWAVCPACESAVVFRALNRMRRVACRCCEHRLHAEDLRSIDTKDWDTIDLPDALLGAISTLWRSPSVRQQRLLHTTAAQLAFGTHHDNLLQSATDAAERWADYGQPAVSVDIVRAALIRELSSPDRSLECDRRQIGLAMLLDPIHIDLYSFLPDTRSAFAEAIRELFPNPFLPIAWKPEWFTSTVRDLATDIYDARDFAAMPILADALQDAGCGDEQVLNHCRANKPHARGCWVVDAILGKS